MYSNANTHTTSDSTYAAPYSSSPSVEQENLMFAAAEAIQA